MEIVFVIACLAVLVIFTGRPPSGPEAPSQGVQLEQYLQAVDRRQRQLRQGRLKDW